MISSMFESHILSFIVYTNIAFRYIVHYQLMLFPIYVYRTTVFWRVLPFLAVHLCECGCLFSWRCLVFWCHITADLLRLRLVSTSCGRRQQSESSKKWPNVGTIILSCSGIFYPIMSLHTSSPVKGKMRYVVFMLFIHVNDIISKIYEKL